MEMKEVLEKLKEAGKITDKDILEVLGISDEMKQIVDTMHLLLCKDNHDTLCEYPQEEIFDEVWEMPAHSKWLKYANRYLKRFNLSETDAINVVSLATNIISNNKRPTLTFISEYIKACQVRESVPRPLPSPLPEHEKLLTEHSDTESSEHQSPSDKTVES